MRAFLRNLFFAVILFCFAPAIWAQVPDETITDPAVQDAIEDLTESFDEEMDFSEFLEILEKLSNNPINLNKTSHTELSQLPFLSDIQVYNILNHIKQYGELLSIYEIQSIEGLDQRTIDRILPYVFVSSTLHKRQTSFSDILKNGKHQTFIRYSRVLQEQVGYSPISDEEYALKPNSRYLGSPDRIYTRHRFTWYNNLSVGITAEKDPGEEFFKGSQKQGFDFYSAHFWMRDIGPLKTLAVGDYQLYFGQGLGLWTGLGFGKSMEISSMKRTGRGIMPYTSVDENKFLRGAAASYQLKNFELFGFYSQKKIDANLIADGDSVDSEEFYVTSLTATGFHRTPNELAKKNVLEEKLYGSRIEYKSNFFQVGATAYIMAFEHSLSRNLSHYNKFEFNGDQLGIISADYNYITRNFNLFGEIARSDNGGIAFNQGILVAPSQNVSLSFNYRNFQKDYQSLYTSAFSESSKVANEQGIFAAIEARVTPKVKFNAYADYFVHPWLKYRVDAPSYGHDYLAQVSYRHSRNANFYFRFRQKNKFLNTVGEPIRGIDLTSKNTYRFHAQYAVSETIVFKSRIEFLTYSVGDQETRNGFMIYQDVAYRPKQSPWAITLRYAMFDTDTYDERIYAYENDVLYAFSIPAYYYRGSRAYVLVKYGLSRNIDLWIRYAQTFYNNRTSVGTGMDETQGRLRSEVKAQMRIKF